MQKLQKLFFKGVLFSSVEEIQTHDVNIELKLQIQRFLIFFFPLLNKQAFLRGK